MRLSDTIGELNDTPTERISIAVETNVDEVKHVFTVLAEEGTVGILLQQTFFQPFGNGVAKDKFGFM